MISGFRPFLSNWERMWGWLGGSGASTPERRESEVPTGSLFSSWWGSDAEEAHPADPSDGNDTQPQSTAKQHSGDNVTSPPPSSGLHPPSTPSSPKGGSHIKNAQLPPKGDQPKIDQPKKSPPLDMQAVAARKARKPIGKRGEQPATPTSSKGSMTRVEYGQMMNYMDKAATVNSMRSEKEARKAFMEQQKEMIRQRGAKLRQDQQGLGMTAVARKAAQAKAQDVSVRVVDLASLSSQDRLDIQKALRSDMTGIREAW